MEEPQNGNENENSSPTSSETEEPDVHPRNKRPLQPEQDYLDSLPSANMYEKSYMHRDVVTHVAVSAAGFFITGSTDGHLTFWKKRAIGVELEKRFRSHHGPIEGLAVSIDGLLCCTISSVKSVNIYCVVNHKKRTINLTYLPGSVEWVYPHLGVKAKLAISVRDKSCIHIYDLEANTNQPIVSKKISFGPAEVMKYNPVFDTLISADMRGIIEYWELSTEGMDSKHMITSEIANCKTSVSSIEVSPDGKLFSTTSPDRKIRIFCFDNGDLKQTINESLKDLRLNNGSLYGLTDTDVERRMTDEKVIEQTENVPPPNAVFDESSNFLIYATCWGIKVVNLLTKEVTRIIGKMEKERFLRIALYQGDRSSKKVRKIPAAAANANESKEPLTDPTLLCCAFNQHRIYLFSRREPTEGRDEFDENPPADSLLAISDIGKADVASLPKEVTLRTTKGDIKMRLYPEQCPITVTNFTTHCRNGYYDNVIFHRVIKGFLVHTGDPQGNGTGGQSIWGREFRDEFHESLRHDTPFRVYMINDGPDANGSQFFITTAATPWLKNRNTVFGEVIEGKEVVKAIEELETDEYGKPLQAVKISEVIL